MALNIIINDTKLKGLIRNLDTTDWHFILHAKITVAWLNVLCTTVTGTVLVATESCDLLCARYNVIPTNLERKCNDCGTYFGVRHLISCCKGGPVIVRHNKVHDKLLYLDQQAFTSTDVWAKPLIHQRCNISKRDIRQGSEKLDTRVT